MEQSFVLLNECVYESISLSSFVHTTQRTYHLCSVQYDARFLRLMLEPDVKPLATSVGHSSKVVLFLLSQTVSIASRVHTKENERSTNLQSHAVPLSRLGLIPPHIISLPHQVKTNIHTPNSNESSVAATVHRRMVILPVDVRMDDSRQLDQHVVQSRADGARAHRVRVARRPADVDRMRRRVT
jgi:hypothetical protein